MGYSAHAVANYFLGLAKDSGQEITPLKIQKLVYIAHGYHLAFTARNEGKARLLVDDEFAEAWEFGPVFPSLYYCFKHFGGDPITSPAREIKFTIVAGETHRNLDIPQIKDDDEFACALLDKIWEVYGSYTGYQLSSITHKDGSPWDKARKRGKGVKNAHIKTKDKKEYYSKLLKK